MLLTQLKRLWHQEEGDYRRQELGDGTQAFVKQCLESEELFNLASSKMSTPDKLRKKEFRYEKDAKDGRADFVIYIDRFSFFCFFISCLEIV